MIKRNGPDCRGENSDFFDTKDSCVVEVAEAPNAQLRRSHTEKRPERRKRKKTGVDDSRIERSINNNDSHQSDRQSDDEDDLCMCGVNSMPLYSEDSMMDDLLTFTPRCVYIPPDGWDSMYRSLKVSWTRYLRLVR